MLKLSKQLFPTGRAFKLPQDSIFYKIYEGICVSEQVLANNIANTLNKLLADNENFLAVDCDLWEKRLGMRNGTGLNIEDRRNLILRKYKYPGNLLYRSHKNYIEQQLREAFAYYIQNNSMVINVREYVDTTIAGLEDSVEHGIDIEHGTIEHANYTGSLYVVANTMSENENFLYDNLTCYFAVEGEALGSHINMNKAMFNEFKRIILTIKPLNTVCIIRASFYE